MVVEVVDTSLMYIGAGLAFGLSALAVGYMQAHVGVAAIGAMAENQENKAFFGKYLLMLVVSESILAFGFLTVMFIMGKV